MSTRTITRVITNSIVLPTKRIPVEPNTGNTRYIDMMNVNAMTVGDVRSAVDGKNAYGQYIIHCAGEQILLRRITSVQVQRAFLAAKFPGEFYVGPQNRGPTAPKGKYRGTYGYADPYHVESDSSLW